jgi:hypothetical protein
MGRREQLRGTGEVGQREGEENLFRRQSRLDTRSDVVVVVTGVLDGVIKDRGIRGQPGHGQPLDVAAQPPAGQQFAGNRVQPQALTSLLQYSCEFHPDSFPALPPSSPGKGSVSDCKT